MRKLQKAIKLLLWVFLAGCLLLRPEAASEGGQMGLHVCAAVVVPALFPFIVLTEYWIQSGYANTLSRFFSPITSKCFHLPGSAATALILGAVGGYPIGARTTVRLYEENHLSKKEAEHLLLFCNNSGPAFVLSVLGSHVFHSITAGVLLYIIHLLSAFLIGVVLRPKKQFAETYVEHSVQPLQTSHIITKSINSAGRTALHICTYVILFAIATRILQEFLPEASIWLLTGLLEISGGADMLSTLNISTQIKFVFSSFMIGFGGICVMLQSVSVVQPSGLSVKKLFVGKLLQSLVSACFAIVSFPFLPLPSPCFSTNGILASLPLQSVACISVVLLIFAIFLKESSGKVKNNRI